jgi:AmmeMemoRadiSam system protein B
MCGIGLSDIFLSMTPDQLITFAAVAEHRNISRAALALHLSQPAVSGQLRQLQDEFGEPLYLRDGRGVRLLVAPHIDFRRGGAAYAHAYRALEGCDADLFVVFGTAHASPPHLFTLTRQDYATPLGAVPTDRAVVDALAAALSEEEVLGDELVHVGEHSCEFQMVWLRWVLGERPFTAVPVLCSSISHLDDPRAATAPFLAALAHVTAGRRVCYVAGADLAHVGPQYGDPRAPTPEELRAFAARDLRTLRFAAAGDADAFHRDAIADDERRRLCGVAPIYAALRAAGRGARLLHHGQWTDGTDMVSFAAAVG